MSVNTIAFLIINGLTMGMVYAMIAMGLILLIKAVGILNFAQGDLLMFGTFFTSWLIVDKALPAAQWLPISIVVWGLTGAVFMLITYWPLRNASYVFAPVIATMGASIAISEGIILLWGAFPRSMPAILQDASGNAMTVMMFGSRIQVQFFLTIGIGALLMFLVYILTEKLFVGKMMRAAAQDKYGATIIGISPFLTIMLTYVITVILISAAGYMVAPVFAVTKNLSSLQLKAFAGTVIGGFGSIKGAIIGCLIVGVVEAFATVQLSVYKEAVVFFVLVAFLIFRPGGLFQSKVKDKA